MKKEFLVEGALCTCQLGTAPGKLKVVDNRFARVNGDKLMGTSMTLGNIFEPPGFGMCNLNPSTPKPCMPVVTQWTGHLDSLRIGTGSFALTNESKATCATGMPNCIAPTTSGQIPIPSVKDWAKADTTNQGDLDYSGKLSSFTEHQIEVECKVGEMRTLPPTTLKVPVVAPRAQIPLPIFDPLEKPATPPEPLCITAVQFTEEGYEAGDTITEEAGTPVEFCIEFNRPPLPSDKIKCAFFTKYPGKPTYEKMPDKNKEMRVLGQTCFWTVTFDEKEAGATIACSFSLNSPVLPRDGEQPTVRYVNITSQEGTFIKEAYWSAKKLARFGEKSSERKEICRNEALFLNIHTRGLFGAEVTIKFYEKGGATGNRFLLQRIANIRDNYQSVICPVSEICATFVQPWGEADVYAVVETNPNLQVSSGIIKVHLDDSAEKPTRDTDSGTGKFVFGEWTPSREKEKKKCPNCEKDLTMADMKKIFPDCQDSGKLQACMDAFNKYMKKFRMDTCWNKAHFFAQARVEVSTSLNIETEAFDYYWEDLITFFTAFQTEVGKKKAKEWGRPERFGMWNMPVSPDNQRKIANWKYNLVPGNRKENDDGWRFRRRGLIQMSGRQDYTKANVYTLKYAGTDIITDDGADKVGEPTGATIAGMGYWFAHGLHKKVHTALNNTAVISEAMGKKVHSERQKAFDKVTSKVFKVGDCLRDTKGKTPEDIITYHIYAKNRTIEKEIPSSNKEPNMRRYIYHDVNDEEHLLGDFGVILVDKIEYRTAPPAIDGKVELIFVKDFEGYKSPDNTVKAAFGLWNSNKYDRWYINPECFAGLLGAMLDYNIDYLVFSGSSDIEGKPGCSITHLNGVATDIAYFRQDKRANGVLLEDKALDLQLNIDFVNALIDYGYTTKGRICTQPFIPYGEKQERYLVDGMGKCTKPPHNNHLHIAGFDFNSIK